MPKFKLTIAYDGTRYAGWQIQPHNPTIQREIEAVIKQVAQEDMHISGAGRTDTGVHALGQVATFVTTSSVSAAEWLRAFNGLLPDDITVLSVEAVADDFHARFLARSKLYRYRILLQANRSALERHRAWQIPYKLDVTAMQAAAGCLIGKHDFSSFQGSPTDTKNPVCHVTRLEIIHSGELIIEIEANRFLKQMVRSIVGTLVEIGRGKLAVGAMQEILAARDRTKAGPTAPPQGLYLVRVDY